ncbi:amphi-Trp domain-containing protein [Halobacteriales archaeon QS_5_70_15]|nr:MAG: amphi-Trp domain-containing protein [Halobacteriales archaeon QS_5_70_15]
MEKVLFEHERRQSRAETAAVLRDVADRLDAGEPVTLSAGSESMTLEVPAEPTFEVKVERETNGSTELSAEFELEWKEDEDTDEGGAGSGLSVE